MRTLLLKASHGSHLYGTANWNSDVDIVTVEMEDSNEFFSIFGSDESKQFLQNNIDTRVFNLRRFLKLCYNGNPNTLEVLFSRSPLYTHPHFKSLILDHKSLFLTRNIISPHLGFARQQIHKQKSIEDNKRKFKLLQHAYRLYSQLEIILTTGTLEFPYPSSVRSDIMKIKKEEVTVKESLRMIQEVEERVKTLLQSVNILLPPAEDSLSKVNRMCHNVYLGEFFSSAISTT